MLKKRVIFTLLYHDGSFMLSRNFRLQRVGDLKWLEKNYDFSQIAFSIDELIILDVGRQDRDILKFCDHVKALTRGCFVPISAGGGIRNIAHAKTLLNSGADKIVLNSVLETNVSLVGELSEIFGSQCIIVSVDIKKGENGFEVLTHNGQKRQVLSASEWLQFIADLPIGEIYLNSIDQDGTGQGFDLELLALLPESISVPIILAGGAGKYQHFSDALDDDRVDAAATANLFNFVGDGLSKARVGLLELGYDLPVWDIKKAMKMKNALA